MRRRKVRVEPLIAKAKEWHGLRRVRLRRLDNVNIEGVLIAAGLNLKRFLAARDWSRRHAPVGVCWPIQGSQRGAQSPPGDC
jgi:hypothetical protein